MSLELFPPSSMKEFGPWFAPATLPSGATPGCKVTNVLTSRPSPGRLSSGTPVTVLPTVAVAVSIAALAAKTSTISVVEPISSFKSRVIVAPTVSSCPGTLVTRNPVLLMDTSYFAGGMLAKTWRPDSFVTGVGLVLVSVLVRVPVAPATVAPVGSVTTPCMVPVEMACPITEVEEKKHKAKRQQRATTTRLLNIQLPPWLCHHWRIQTVHTPIYGLPKVTRERIWKTPWVRNPLASWDLEIDQSKSRTTATPRLKF